jgi:hypothetical protein
VLGKVPQDVAVGVEGNSSCCSLLLGEQARQERLCCPAHHLATGFAEHTDCATQLQLVFCSMQVRLLSIHNVCQLRCLGAEAVSVGGAIVSAAPRCLCCSEQLINGLLQLASLHHCMQDAWSNQCYSSTQYLIL